MVTVAVANSCEHKQQALQYIQDTSIRQGIKTLSIAPSQGTLYKNNKKVRLKKYISSLEQENELGLLMVQVTREALYRGAYEGINFDIALVCETYQAIKNLDKKNYIPPKFIKKLHSNYYVIPDRYSWEKEKHITYGWSKNANVSASSVQENAEGIMSMQCCIQRLECFKGSELIGPKEVCIEHISHDVLGVLGGIATMVLYNINQ